MNVLTNRFAAPADLCATRSWCRLGGLPNFWLQELQNHASIALVSAVLTLVFGVAAWLLARHSLLQLDETFLVRAVAKTRPSALRVAAGVALLLVGITLLFLPGPGVVLMLFGAILAELPGRERFMRWVFRKPEVLREVNALRQRHRKRPLLQPDGSNQE
jgi:hypothetical protein